MKSIFKLTGISICIALIISSCGKTNNGVKMIPRDALVVVHLNTRSLMSKISWDEVKKTGWFTQLYNDTAVKAWTKNLMDNPQNTGIDLDAGVTIFMQKQVGQDGQIVLEGEIRDRSAFESFNKNLAGNSGLSKDGDINLLPLKDGAVAGWDDKKFAYVANAERYNPTVNYNGSIDTATASPARAGTQNLTLACKKLFSLNSDSSMAKVEKFSSLLKEEGDFHVWQNNEQIARGSMQMGMLSMMKLDLFLKGNITASTGNFENGKITFNQKFYTSPELTDILKKNSAAKVSTDIIKKLPSQDVSGVLAIHFKPEGLKEIISLTGLDGFLNIFLSKGGITLDDFVKANKGDIMFAVTDFTMKKDSVSGGTGNGATSYTFEKPDANFLFSASIGDRPAFDKLMAAGKKLTEDMGSSAGIATANNDKFFAIGNSQQNVSKYISGSDSRFAFTDKFSDHPITLFVDIQKVLATAAASQEMSKDSGAKAIMDESVKMWQNAYALGGDYKDDAFVMNVEVNLVDKNTNSLKQLNGYFDKIAKEVAEKNKQARDRQRDEDSIPMPPFQQLDTAAARP